MEIIMQEEVSNLGQIGDVVTVRNGYARNYLLPRGLAVEANRRNVRMLDHTKRLLAEKKDRLRRQARALGEVLSALTVTIPVRAGEEDRLFGSVTNIHIEEALKLQGVGIERRKILLDEPIKQLGTFEVPIHLGGDVRGNVTVEVVREA